jgi:membrane protease YdiL (CAAX protease family)
MRRVIAIGAAPAIVLAMRPVFDHALARWGMPAGYTLGLATYGALCFALSVGLLGPRRALAAVHSFGWPRTVGEVALLLWPLPFPFVFRFLPAVGSASASVIAASAIAGLVIALVEEGFWRGVFAQLFPTGRAVGVVWSAVWFALWHLAPLATVPNRSPGGAASFVAYALVLGLTWGEYARRKQAIGALVIVHAIHDALGLSGAVFLAR